ncbi:MAG: glycoside hydrolase family 15 protein [Promethearchaeota archaeon]
MKKRISSLFLTSVNVIEDCCLENGAIVAANPTKEYYPPVASHYFYVWPRDASYICIAADIAGNEEIQEKFFNWCWNRAEDLQNTGLFLEKYFVNGLKALHRFQPDQTGTVLSAIWHHYNHQAKLDKSLKFEELITCLANGLCNEWRKDHFSMVTNDLWEERLTFPDLCDNFTYSLAACIHGLECACKMCIDNKEREKWMSTAKQMRNLLEHHYIEEHFVRSYGKLIDRAIDVSVLGLVYPFAIYDANDPKMISTVKEIEDKLVINGGVHRYQFDYYDGWVYGGMLRNKGAGAWPLLNFWMTIYYALQGNTEKAQEYFQWVLERIEKYIPEQLFDNALQVSVSPLAWSHAMFLIAISFLELIK